MMLSLLARLRGRWVQAMDSLWDRRQQRYCQCGEGSKILSSGRVVNSGDAGNVVLGKWTWLAGELLVYPHGGRIDIGDHCYVGEGTRIWSLSNVRIGSRVFLSHGVNVHDNDAHSLSAAERHRHFRERVQTGAASFVENVSSGDIEICDDAWIGFNSTILKGVRIGEGAIIGACSTVTRDVAPYTVVVGNPAAPVGQSLP
ncbi:acyltransferase [Streptomyces sp. AcH 505]|uniref:acyltransferase n=1 Tax=Streptomyces sp. AcH 505 TaxID=352211 RepID=UPI00099CD7F8